MGTVTKQDAQQELELEPEKFAMMESAKFEITAKYVGSHRVNLLASSNIYGLIACGTESGVNIYGVGKLLSGDKTQLSTINLGCQPTHLAFNSDSTLLSVTVARAKISLAVMIFSITNLQIVTEVQLAQYPGVRLQDLSWNPELPTIFSSVLSDGSAAIWTGNNNSFQPTLLNKQLGITCMDWSPKGKQLVLGLSNGALYRVDPTGAEKARLPGPPIQQMYKVFSICWFANTEYLVCYSDSPDVLSPTDKPPIFMVISVKKDKSIVFTDFQDCWYGEGDKRIPQVYFTCLRQWGCVLSLSAQSVDSCLLSHVDDKWRVCTLNDTCRISIPLNQNDYSPNYATGVCVNVNAQQPVKLSDTVSVAPCPVIAVLSTNGTLLLYNVVNRLPSYSNLSTPPKSLSLPGSVSHGGTNQQSAAGVPANQQPAQGNLTKLQPASAFTSTPQNKGAPSLSQAFKTPSEAAPSVFGKPGATLFDGQPKADTTNKPNAAALFGSQQKDSSAAALFGGQQKTDSSAAAALFGGQQKTDPAAALFSGQQKPATSYNQAGTLFGQFKAGASQPPPVMFDAKPDLQQGSAIPANTFGTVLNAAKPNETPVKQPAPESATPPQSEAPSQKTESAKAKKEAEEKRAAEILRQAKLEAKRQADLFVYKTIEEQIRTFDQELAKSKATISAPLDIVMNKEESTNITSNLQSNLKFSTEITENTKSLNSEVHSLKLKLFETAALIERAKQLERSLLNNQYKEVMRARPLNPELSALDESISRSIQYLTKQLPSVDDKLDMLWENSQLGTGDKNMFRSDLVYQTMNTIESLIAIKKAEVDALCSKFGCLELSPEKLVERSRLMDGMNRQLERKRKNRIREYLLNRTEVPTVRSKTCTTLKLDETLKQATQLRKLTQQKLVDEMNNRKVTPVKTETSPAEKPSVKTHQPLRPTASLNITHTKTPDVIPVKPVSKTIGAGLENVLKSTMGKPTETSNLSGAARQLSFVTTDEHITPPTSGLPFTGGKGKLAGSSSAPSFSFNQPSLTGGIKQEAKSGKDKPETKAVVVGLFGKPAQTSAESAFVPSSTNTSSAPNVTTEIPISKHVTSPNEIPNAKTTTSGNIFGASLQSTTKPSTEPFQKAEVTVSAECSETDTESEVNSQESDTDSAGFPASAATTVASGTVTKTTVACMFGGPVKPIFGASVPSDLKVGTSSSGVAKSLFGALSTTSSTLASTLSDPAFTTSSSASAAVKITTTATLSSTTVSSAPSQAASLFGGAAKSTPSKGQSAFVAPGVTTSTETSSVLESTAKTTEASSGNITTTSSSQLGSLFGRAITSSLFGTTMTTTVFGSSTSSSTKSAELFATAAKPAEVTGTSGVPVTLETQFSNMPKSSESTISKEASGVFGAPVITTVTTTATQAANLFGAAATSTQASSVFQSAASTSSGGFFGKPTTAAASIFGGSSTPVTSSSTGVASLFGAAKTGSIFGSADNATTTTTSSSQATATAVFGGTPSFGSTTTTTASAFGSSSAGGLFGKLPSTSADSSSTNNVFGGTSSGGSSGVFESSQTGSLFGGSSNQTSGSVFGGSMGLGGKPDPEKAKQNPFGGAALSGSSSSTDKSIFGGQASSPLGAKANSGFGGQASSTFGTAPTNTAANVFSSAAAGSPSSPGGFGAAPTFGGAPAFGSPPAFGSLPAFGSRSAFGSPSALGQTAPVFGSNTQSAPSAGSVFGSNVAGGDSAQTFGALAHTGGSIPSSVPAFRSQSVFSSGPVFGGNTQNLPLGENNQQQQNAFGSSSSTGSPFGGNASGGNAFSGYRG